MLFRSGLTTDLALERIRTEVRETAEIREFLRFVEGSKRGIARPEILTEEETGE